MKRRFTLTLLMAACTLMASAQYQRHIVQFTDKKGTEGTIANPTAYLSAKAIDRRTKQSIAIDSTDLPISKSYLDSIRSIPNVTILNQSKWLNQILIRTSDAAALARINSFPFVKANTPIAPRIKEGARSNKFAETEENIVGGKPQGPQDIQLDYGGTFNQIKIHKGEFLHNMGFTGQAMTIAILDAGFFNYLNNPAMDSVRLQGRVLGTWDYVTNDASVNEDNVHGANCFSIIASNRPGIIVGSAPHSRFWLLRTEDAGSEYPVEEQNWAAAAEFADSAGVDMISSSLGYADFDDPAYNHSYLQRDGNTSMITRAADLAAKKGIVVMNSAGNSGASAGDVKYIACPADGDSVVAVGATDVNGNIASFSSWGPNGAGKLKPNIVSVGQGTVYASTSGNAVAGNGTSYSNPNIAGLIACFWQAFPELSNMQLIDAVQKSANKYSNPDIRYGYGLPDFRKAFYTVLKERATFNATLNNCAATFTWQSKDNSNMQYKLFRRLPNDTGFIAIATVTGKSTAFQTNNYTYTDSLKNYIGQGQYLLQQVNGTDSTVELGVLAVNVTNMCNVSATPNFSIRPNPVKNGMVQIYVSTGEPIPNMSVVIVNMMGQVVKKARASAAIGNTMHSIPVSGMATGMYVIKIYNGNEDVFTGKLINHSF
ncbi:MAG TPA: S8 family serine peptidase [Chitinophagaceae bacterium]|nr:S8 family serine peptidase [Chitinophagaceae bacterium]